MTRKKFIDMMKQRENRSLRDGGVFEILICSVCSVFSVVKLIFCVGARRSFPRKWDHNRLGFRLQPHLRTAPQNQRV